MADYTLLVPFILESEGGFSNHPNDPGGATNKGITYGTWCNYFGTNTYARFMQMPQADWEHIFKSGYWDKCLGDQIQDQNAANMLVDWTWNSGNIAVKHLQQLLKIHDDGILGTHTLTLMNAHEEPALFNLLKQNRIDFVTNLVLQNPSLKVFLTGWLNRINRLSYN